MKLYRPNTPAQGKGRLAIHVPSEQRERAGRNIYVTERWKQLSKRLRQMVGCCQDCSASNTRLVLDHIIELKDGGEPFAPSNLIVRCWSCHQVKTKRVAREREAER